MKKNNSPSFLFSLTLSTFLWFGCEVKTEDAKPSGSGPTLIATNLVTNITANSAKSGGGVSDDGGQEVTARGVCWGTNPNPTISNSKTTDGVGTGSFVSTLTGLNSGTIYYVRSYATNKVGTGYGPLENFKTITPETVHDQEGNRYEIVKIGTQTWMKENLRATKYRDGTDIPQVNNNIWETTNSGAIAGSVLSGEKLYNFYAVVNSKELCPVGYHIPTESEWATLENFFGGSADAGGKLKLVSSLWKSPNTGATNESGFSALPTGMLTPKYNYSSQGVEAIYWSRTTFVDNTQYAKTMELFYDKGESKIFERSKRTGAVVRCLKN